MPQMLISYLIHFLFILFILNDHYHDTLKYNKAVRVRAINRVGPHNKDVLSIIFGSLLGDGHAEKRLLGTGTRITFYQESSHIEYLLYLHKLLSNLGYCNTRIPTVGTRLGVGGKVRKTIRFGTWTYTSFNWIHDLWYINGVKDVPLCIKDYLSPLALAIWIMDDGSKVGKGLKFSTNSFTHKSCLILVNVLNEKFNLKSSIQNTGTKDQYIIYIWKESMGNLRKIVSPYVIPEMRYKID
jgi:ubiquinol-cytochrome c reductase cytochrome b subunit